MGNLKKKAYLLTIISCLFAVVFTIPAAASPDINNGRGNISYVYDYDNNSVAIAEAMEFSESVGGRDMGIADFTELTDVKTDGKNIYLVDAGTNRLVITDSGFELIKVIDGYEENGVKKPFGRILSVCLANNEIYAVDSGNALIIRFNADGTTKNVYGKPDISLYNPDYIYNPEKVAVDYAGNMYVIAKGISDGIIQLDEYGKFCCFIGAPKVVPNWP